MLASSIVRKMILRILLINEYMKRRGAEQIVADQIKLFSDYGNYVRCLCFGIGDANELLDEYDILPISKKSKLLFNIYIYAKIRRYIRNYNPDIIVVHNIFSSPITIYRALKGFSAIQIIHDYKVICPKAWCVYREIPHMICAGYICRKCLKLCSNRKERIITFFQLWLVKKCETLRKKYIKVCVSPSERLNKYLLNYGYNSVCINNPFQVSMLLESKHIENSGILKLIYVGAVSYDKGILDFCNTIIHDDNNYTLDIYGRIADSCIEETEKIVALSNGRIKFRGYRNHDELILKYREYDYLVMPSICMDNYPTVILEAMGCGVVVVGTDRGGIPEMLADGRGFVYKYGDERALENMLEKLYKLSDDNYGIMRKKSYEYVCQNNSLEKYCKQMDDLMKNVVKESRHDN